MTKPRNTDYRGFLKNVPRSEHYACVSHKICFRFCAKRCKNTTLHLSERAPDLHCVLHIGTEKTATTFIQNWLYQNTEQLSAQGVALTKASGYTNNRILVSYFQDQLDNYLKKRNVHSKKEKDALFTDFEESFSAEIAEIKKTHKTVMFTSEHFHSRMTKLKKISELKEFLDRFFDSYSIICYFREQSKVRTSLYSTVVKINYGKDILDFQSGVTPKNHYYGYYSFFRKWEKVFGKSALIPRLFSKDHMVDGDIRKDLLANALPQVDPEALDYEIDSRNESLSADQAVLFQGINATRPNFIGKYLDPLPGLVKRAVKRSQILDQKTTISDPRQGEMYDAFNDDNIKFFSRYFGEEKNLFPRPDDTGTVADTEKRFDVSELGDFLNAILEVKNIIALGKSEITFLRDLALRLHAAGAISNTEAITLLKLANRARPSNKTILSTINKLRKGA